MIYSKVENGIICSKVSASTQPEGYVLDTSNSRVGERRDFFDNDWNRKALSILFKENIIDIPEGYKLDQNEFVEMTHEEKVKAKILKPTEREKIDNGEIVPKTMDELYKDKLVTAKEYNEYIDTMRKTAYVNETDPMRWDILEGKATEADWKKAKQVIRDKFKKAKE